MNIIVLDTETAGSLEKPFCYDVGYVIYNVEENTRLEEKHFVVEQIWHNLELFDSAYYADKRNQYVQLMRSRKATMDKFGYIMREMARDIKKYNVTDAYAYNSDFDDKVITRACDWFKCINPLETIAIHDIWGYSCEWITKFQKYKDFCDDYGYYTDTGNYKQSAECVYRFITGDIEFEEAHMGLHDAQIELEILRYCLSHGATINWDYKVTRVLTRDEPQDFKVVVDNDTIYEGQYVKKYIRNNLYKFATE